MKVDQTGNLYATGPEGYGSSPPTAKHIGTIGIPEHASNLAWGDADYKTLYITASTSIYRIFLKIPGMPPLNPHLRLSVSATSFGCDTNNFHGGSSNLSPGRPVLVRQSAPPGEKLDC